LPIAVRGKTPLSHSSRVTLFEQRLNTLEKESEWWKEWTANRAARLNSAVVIPSHLETVGEAAIESSVLVEDINEPQAGPSGADRVHIQPSPEPSSSKEL